MKQSKELFLLQRLLDLDVCNESSRYFWSKDLERVFEATFLAGQLDLLLRERKRVSLADASDHLGVPPLVLGQLTRGRTVVEQELMSEEHQAFLREEIAKAFSTGRAFSSAFLEEEFGASPGWLAVLTAADAKFLALKGKRFWFSPGHLVAAAQERLRMGARRATEAVSLGGIAFPTDSIVGYSADAADLFCQSFLPSCLASLQLDEIGSVWRNSTFVPRACEPALACRVNSVLRERGFVSPGDCCNVLPEPVPFSFLKSLISERSIAATDSCVISAEVADALAAEVKILDPCKSLKLSHLFPNSAQLPSDEEINFLLQSLELGDLFLCKEEEVWFAPHLHLLGEQVPSGEVCSSIASATRRCLAERGMAAISARSFKIEDRLLQYLNSLYPKSNQKIAIAEEHQKQLERLILIKEKEALRQLIASSATPAAHLIHGATCLLLYSLQSEPVLFEFTGAIIPLLLHTIIPTHRLNESQKRLLEALQSSLQTGSVKEIPSLIRDEIG